MINYDNISAIVFARKLITPSTNTQESSAEELKRHMYEDTTIVDDDCEILCNRFDCGINKVQKCAIGRRVRSSPYHDQHCVYVRVNRRIGD